MPHFAIWTDEIIYAAPPVARFWLEQEIMRVFDQWLIGNRSTDGSASLLTGEREEPKPPSRDARAQEAQVESVSVTVGNAGPAQEEPATGDAAIQKLIAERAYELWENQGKPHGCDLIHWREAELEIRDCVERASLPSGGERPLTVDR